MRIASTAALPTASRHVVWNGQEAVPSNGHKDDTTFADTAAEPSHHQRCVHGELVCIAACFYPEQHVLQCSYCWMVLDTCRHHCACGADDVATSQSLKHAIIVSTLHQHVHPPAARHQAWPSLSSLFNAGIAPRLHTAKHTPTLRRHSRARYYSTSNAADVGMSPTSAVPS